MTDVYELSMKVDSRDVKTATKDLSNLSNSAEDAGNSVEDLQGSFAKGAPSAKSFGKETQIAGTKTAGMGRNAGMAGIQIQQMVGQLQLGVSPFVALSQQAADLGIVLGAPLIGVMVSLGAVAGGVLAQAFGNLGESAEDLLERIEDLSDGFKNLDEDQKAFAASQITQQIVEKQQEMEKLAEKVAKAEAEISGLEATAKAFSKVRIGEEAARAVERQSEELLKLRAQLSAAGVEVDNLNEKLSTLGTPEAGGGSGSSAPDTPWWGGDEAVEAQAFDIRMQLWKDEQAMIVEGLEQRRDAFASYYEEYATARIDSARLAAEQQIAIEEELAKEQERIRRQDIQDAQKAEQIKQKNKLTISRSFDTIFENAMDSSSKSIFEIGKIGAATKAAVDARAAINATLAQGGALAWPAAIATGAAAFSNVTKILGTKYGQTGSNVGSAPSIPEPQEPASGPTQNSEVTINIQGNADQGIVDQLRDIFSSDEVVIPRGSAQARELSNV